MTSRPSPKTLAEALHLIIKAEALCSAQDLAEWTGRDDSTVYDWIKGAEAKWNDIRMIVRHCGSDRIRLIIGGAMFHGTDVECTPTRAEKCQANALAVIQSASEAAHEGTDFANKVVALVGDDHVSQGDLLLIRREADEAKQKIDAAVRGAEAMADRPGPRLAG